MIPDSYKKTVLIPARVVNGELQFLYRATVLKISDM